MTADGNWDVTFNETETWIRVLHNSPTCSFITNLSITSVKANCVPLWCISCNTNYPDHIKDFMDVIAHIGG